MRHMIHLLLGCLMALPALSQLIPQGDWPLDGTRTALQMEGELFRNCGRVLERWDLLADPPLLVDSLVLDSPPIDLLEWDGLLLILREDGLLEMRHPADGWDPPLWTWQGLDCATSLLRHGRWLLPVSPWMPLLDLEDPREPVVAQEVLGGWDGNFGGMHAALVGDTLLGDYFDCCGSCWDVVIDQRYLELGNEVPPGSAQSIGWIPGLGWDYYSPLAAADHLLLIGTYAGLQVLDPATMTLEQTIPMPESPEEMMLTNQLGSPLVLVSGPAGTMSMLVAAQSTPPVQVLDTLAIHATSQLRLINNRALLVSDGTTQWASTADPAHLQVEGSLGAFGTIRSQAWDGDRLLVRGNGLHILADHGGGWEVESALPLAEGRQLSVMGSVAIADVPDGVAVIDLRDTQMHLEQVIASAPVDRLLMVEHGAVWQCGDSLVFTNLSIPEEPVEMARLACPGATVLAGNASTVVAGSTGNLRIYQVEPNLHQVIEAGSLDSEFSSVAMSGDFLLTARIVDPWVNPSLEVQLVDLSIPLQPRMAGEWQRHSVESFSLQAGASRVGILMRDYWPGWDPYTRRHLNLYDVAGDSTLVLTAILNCEERDVASFALSRDTSSEGMLAVHVAGRGLECFRDPSTTALEPQRRGPAQFELHAAPNPFNPLTHLSFTLEAPGRARLAIHDLLGREVAVPAAGDFPAGVHDIIFDATALPSGLYFAQLDACGDRTVAKLALVR